METYVECLVYKGKNTGMFLLKILLGIIAVFGFLVGTFNLLGWIVMIAAGVGAFFAHQQSEIEFEYLYVDKQLTIDKILARSKRKQVEVLDMEKIEIFAPLKSWHLNGAEKAQAKEIDYSSGKAQQPERRYYLIYNGDDGRKRLILEPNEALVDAMKFVAPRKVFKD